MHAYGRLYIQCGVENKLHCCGRERDGSRSICRTLHSTVHTARSEVVLTLGVSCSAAAAALAVRVRACVQLRNFPSSTLHTVSASPRRPLSARVGENCISGSGLNCPSFTLGYYNDNTLTTPKIQTSHIIPTTYGGKSRPILFNTHLIHLATETEKF